MRHHFGPMADRNSFSVASATGVRLRHGCVRCGRPSLAGPHVAGGAQLTRRSTRLGRSGRATGCGVRVYFEICDGNGTLDAGTGVSHIGAPLPEGEDS